jgi:hypothetical protein
MAKGFRDAINMARPGEAKAIAIVETALILGEPTWQRAIVQHRPDIDAGGSGDCQNVGDVIDRIAVPMARAGFEP